MRSVLLAALAGATVFAQTAPIEFEVASMKATSDFTQDGRITRLPGERGYHGANMSLMAYVRVAYQLNDTQISGPDWMNAQRFDVEAKAPGPSTVDDLHIMLQHLLEQRFHMKVRRESREQTGYRLVIDQGGPKLKDHDPGDKVVGPIRPGPGPHAGTNVTMSYFAFYLSNELQRTVIDKTGLAGHYDFELTWSGDDLDPSAPLAGLATEIHLAPMPTGPSLINALKQQLGLRLDAAKVPVEHLVIEHIEPLTGN